MSVLVLHPSVYKSRDLNICSLEGEILSLLRMTRRNPLRKMPVERAKEFQSSICSVYEVVKRLYRRFPEKVKGLYLMAMSAMLGGEVSLCDSDFRRFIEINRLEYKFLALRIGMEVDEDGDPLIPVVDKKGREHLYSWNEIIREPILGGWRFSIHGVVLFETNRSYKLKDDYLITYRGITPLETESMIAFDKQDASEWGGGYVLEVWTLLKDIKEGRPTMGVGDHCSVVLKNSEGEVFSLGKFFRGNSLKFADYFTLFSRKRGRMVSPDLFVYYTDNARNFQKVSIHLDEEQYQRVFAQMDCDRKQREPIFSILKNNCVNYVKDLLETCFDLKVECETPLLSYFLQVIFPKRLYNYFRGLTKMPKWAYFIPPIYLLTLIGGIGLRLLDLKNHTGIKGSDYAFREIFFFPWRVTIFHPLALRESLNRAAISGKITL
ncbi:MAG: hypothetical protein MRY21_04090 [Simkaniaceae bacterium]|nr:hypothetical protein [Simkaniaceae bacterium]